MKRSEANAIYKAREAFSTEFDCVSIQMTDANGDKCNHSGDCLCTTSAEYFSTHGCDICPDGLAGSVFDVIYVRRADIKARKFDNIHEGSICGGCLCSLVNGDDSDLDYHTTEEDEPSLSRA